MSSYAAGFGGNSVDEGLCDELSSPVEALSLGSSPQYGRALGGKDDLADSLFVSTPLRRSAPWFQVPPVSRVIPLMAIERPLATAY